MKKKKSRTVSDWDLVCASQELNELQSRYLRERGWDYRCDVPGAFWLWHKKLDDGRTIAVGLFQALDIEEKWPLPWTIKHSVQVW